MARFIWICGAADIATPLEAPDEETAFRMVIASRLQSAGEDPKHTCQEQVNNAVAWFRKNDELVEVNCSPLQIEPYEGEIPDFVSDSEADCTQD